MSVCVYVPVFPLEIWPLSIWMSKLTDNKVKTTPELNPLQSFVLYLAQIES